MRLAICLCIFHHSSWSFPPDITFCFSVMMPRMLFCKINDHSNNVLIPSLICITFIMLLLVIIRTFIASTFDINIVGDDSLQFLANRWQHTVCKRVIDLRRRHRYRITKILIITTQIIIIILAIVIAVIVNMMMINNNNNLMFYWKNRLLRYHKELG